MGEYRRCGAVTGRLVYAYVPSNSTAVRSVLTGVLCFAISGDLGEAAWGPDWESWRESGDFHSDGTDGEVPEVSEQFDSNESDPEGISLEDLRRVYGAESDEEAVDGVGDDRGGPSGCADGLERGVEISSRAEFAVSADDVPVTPAGIVEAVLFVGNPNGGVVTAEELAGLMRGVSEREIHDIVDALNEQYKASGRSLRIVERSGGFAMGLAPEVARIQDAFYGKVREIKLSQAAVDCLALIAYQPGISRQRIDQQRSEASGALLNQLVRRRLVAVRRETRDGQPPCLCYYPTERFLELTGLDSLDDLPQVEEFDPSLPTSAD